MKKSQLATKTVSFEQLDGQRPLNTDIFLYLEKNDRLIALAKKGSVLESSLLDKLKKFSHALHIKENESLYEASATSTSSSDSASSVESFNATPPDSTEESQETPIKGSKEEELSVEKTSKENENVAFIAEVKSSSEIPLEEKIQNFSQSTPKEEETKISTQEESLQQEENILQADMSVKEPTANFSTSAIESTENSFSVDIDPLEEEVRFSPSAVKASLSSMSAFESALEEMKELSIQAGETALDKQKIIDNKDIKESFVRISAEKSISEEIIRLKKAEMQTSTPEEKIVLVQKQKELKEKLSALKLKKLPEKEVENLAGKASQILLDRYKEKLAQASDSMDAMLLASEFSDELQLELTPLAESMEELEALELAELGPMPEIILAPEVASDSKDKTAPVDKKAAIASLSAYMAYRLGYRKKSFLVDLSLSSIFFSENLPKEQLPESAAFPRRLISDITSSTEGVKTSTEADATLVLQFVKQYFQQESTLPFRLPLVEEKIQSALKVLEEKSLFNQESQAMLCWRDVHIERDIMDARNLCAQISHETLKSFKTLQ